ncbi:MAG: hypothetical protein ABIZ80_25600, partial [Bryobacteraceae bacterium]
MTTSAELDQEISPEFLESVERLGASVVPDWQSHHSNDAPFWPSVPESIDDTGISATLIEQLILRKLYFHGQVAGHELSRSLGFKFSLIEGMIDGLKRLRLIEVKSSLGFGMVSAVLTLTEAGRGRARECIDKNQYAGPAPVPLEQYRAGVRAQRQKSGWLKKDALDAAFQHMVVTPQMITQLGPAVNSGKSFLLYGQPGNGTTYMAEALFQLDATPVFIPYAIESEGMIIRVFDPVYHTPVDAGADAE